MEIVIDTESTGIPKWKEPSIAEHQPHIVELAYFSDAFEKRFIIKPDDWTIPDECVAIHGITTERAMDEGLPIIGVLEEFRDDAKSVSAFIGFNTYFDTRMVRIQCKRNGMEDFTDNVKRHDVMWAAKKDLKSGKTMKLVDVYRHYFNEELAGAHGALPDAKATHRLFMHLRGLGHFQIGAAA